MRAGVARGNGLQGFSLRCPGFSFLFRGVQRGYFSFQRVRSEVVKADELLLSARRLRGRNVFPLADHGAMTASAILANCQRRSGNLLIADDSVASLEYLVQAFNCDLSMNSANRVIVFCQRPFMM